MLFFSSSHLHSDTTFLCNHTSQSLEETDLITLQRNKKPPMYKVIMLNDDFTAMDFVVHVLETIFQKNNDEAIKIMFEIHHKGAGNCGVFTREIAETKRAQTLQLAKNYQYPLQCILEKE